MFSATVRPRDTRLQTTRALTMHAFELGPKKIQVHFFDKLLLEMHGYLRSTNLFEKHGFFRSIDFDKYNLAIAV